MNETLSRLLDAALHDASMRALLMATKQDADPIAAFCRVATELGYPVTPGELVSMGEESIAAMLRSVNGGGVDAFDGWDDAYEMFFTALGAGHHEA
jgi:hypothetical protein